LALAAEPKDVQQAVDVRSGGDLLVQFTRQRGLQVLAASIPPPGSTQYGSSPGRILRMVSSSSAGVISRTQTRSVMGLLYHERSSDTVDS
jgi:hypothetical protein